VIARCFVIADLTFVQSTENPDDIGPLGTVQLMVDGDPADPVAVYRCVDGWIRLVYCNESGEAPPWAYDRLVRERIREFVNAVIEQWSKEAWR
jgi:hypothetical protein